MKHHSKNKLIASGVWTLRIVIGVIFITSGFAKSVDIWGFVYKIEEYLNVWDFAQPRSLVLMAALAISSAEFLLGLMLTIGAYKRTCVWFMLAMMAVMLPLTAYIWIENPVSDCGCFGDMIRISNSETFFKNVFITAGLIFLALKNRLVRGLFHAYTQWITAISATLYILAIAFIGYNIQPLLDFRSFPVGSQLIQADSEIDEPSFAFIYEKDGIHKSFTEDSLPDSTWTFVDRKQTSGSLDSKTELNIYDEDGNNITADIADAGEDKLIIVIPQGERADVSFTYLINELQKHVESHGGSIIELGAFSDDELEEWKDLSMATYPIYSAESTTLKELARGNMAAIYLRDGQIIWKRNLTSINSDNITSSATDISISESLKFPSEIWLFALTIGLISLYIAIYCVDHLAILHKKVVSIKK